MGASLIGVAGALLMRRRSAGIVFLVLIAFLGMWRGGHAAAVDVGDRWYGAPETSGVVTIEGELLTDPAPANFNTRLRLDVVAATVNGRRSETFFKADVFADRLLTSKIREQPADQSTDSDTETVTSCRGVTTHLQTAASPSQAEFRQRR